MKGNIVIEKKVKVKKVKKEKSIEFYFDEETDKKILGYYDNKDNDIMSISLVNNIKPFEVVSLLIRHKIISKRNDARGYDKYKETDEYKNKLNKK